MSSHGLPWHWQYCSIFNILYIPLPQQSTVLQIFSIRRREDPFLNLAPYSLSPLLWRFNGKHFLDLKICRHCAQLIFNFRKPLLVIGNNTRDRRRIMKAHISPSRNYCLTILRNNSILCKVKFHQMKLCLLYILLGEIRGKCELGFWRFWFWRSIHSESSAV
jgi:hypothetical protein